MERHKIIVIDDMKYIRTSIIKNLLEMGCAKANIVEAETAEEGLQLIKHHTTKGKAFDLILCDWNMPGGKGIDLLKKVRNIKELQKTPFILITTENERDKIVEAARSGVSGFIIKPFEAQDFQDKVRSILVKDIESGS